ncbi:glycosyltransferase [Klebsiella quasipneumoniae]|uniref:glycosyltransferase n=1 Tax=Klebsiella quasipneumoniae TaxID=1463165 RepID=UPI001EF81A3F|nr:glycosyltransferase [Klebsiella quasipneumoniae]ULJ32491.1 glycosyltransferase [Klebsiella quasipneumoniae]
MCKEPKKEIIFLSMFLPEPSVPEAGQKLAFQRLNTLIESDISVHLISFVNEREISYLKNERFNKCKSVHLIKITKFRRLYNLLTNPLLPLSIGIRTDKRIFKIVNDILSNTPNSNIHVEYAQGLQNIPHEKYSEVSLVLHDVISQSVDRFYTNETNIFKRLFLKFQRYLIINWERKLLQVGKIITLNIKDQKIVTEIIGVPEDKVSVDYPSVDSMFKNIERSRVEKATAMFWGAMNRKENEDAVIWFINEIMPIILEKVSCFKLYVVGASPSPYLQSLANESIIITGFVESPIKYFERAEVAVVPLRFGAGIKIKVIEALEAKIPVITTTVGAEGVSTNLDLLHIADDNISFAESVIKNITQ